MRPETFALVTNAIAAAETHGALELLRAGLRLDLTGAGRRVELNRRVDTRHRVLTRGDALEREVGLCAEGEETWW